MKDNSIYTNNHNAVQRGSKHTYASNTIYYEMYGIAPTIVHMLYKKKIFLAQPKKNIHPSNKH